MEIEIPKNKEPKYFQLAITAWTKPKEPEQNFVPIDIVRDPRPLEKKKRGRTPKPRIIAQPGEFEEAKVNTDNNGPQIQEMEIEEVANSKRRGPYKRTNYETRLKVLEEYIEFKRIPRYDLDGKPLLVSDFLRGASLTYAKSESTIKDWCSDYEKDHSLLETSAFLLWDEESSTDWAG